MPTSLNGFVFSAAPDSTGEHVTLVAHKDDHEGRRTEVFRFEPAELSALVSELLTAVAAAKLRRKAIRKAAKSDSSSLT